MATPLTDSINALTAYANEVTGGSDTNLSDAVHTLASGYGGGSSFQLLHSEEINVIADVQNQIINVGDINIGQTPFQGNKLLYVCIRDKAGKRNGYYFGGEQIIVLPDGETYSTVVARILYRCNTYGTITSEANTYGIYCYSYNANGNLNFRARYNSTTSLTINGTFKIDIYLLSRPEGTNPFV